jgi:hypothetical protein
MSRSKWEKTRSNNFTTFTRPGLMGNNVKYHNAHEMELGYQFNGSGSDSFGGADKWPALEIKIPFPAGREDLRDDFGERFRKIIDNLLRHSGLNV